MVSMAPQRRLLLAHTGWATVVDPRGRDDMERSVIGAIGPGGQSRIDPCGPPRPARTPCAASPTARRRRARGARGRPDDRGRRGPPGAGRRRGGVALGAAALLVPAPTEMPRDLVALWFALPLALTLSCLAIARVEVHPYSPWASPAGQRLLGALTRRTGTPVTSVRTSPPSPYAASARSANRSCGPRSPTATSPGRSEDAAPGAHRGHWRRHRPVGACLHPHRTKHPFCCRGQGLPCRCRRAPKGNAMRAAALYSAAGSLLLTTLTAARPPVRPMRRARPNSAAPPWPPHAPGPSGIDFGRCSTAGHARRPAVRHGVRPAGLRTARRQADQADRQPGQGHAEGPAQQQAQGAPAGRPRLQPGRPGRVRHVLPADRRAAGVEADRRRVRPRRLRPARRGPLRAAVLRGPRHFLKAPDAVAGAPLRVVQEASASPRRRRTRAAAPGAPGAGCATTTR